MKELENFFKKKAEEHGVVSTNLFIEYRGSHCSLCVFTEFESRVLEEKIELPKSPGKTVIAVEIENCKSCPHFKIRETYSTDGWDRMEDWVCGKLNKKIQGAVEWHEEKKILVPEWCPILIEK